MAELIGRKEAERALIEIRKIIKDVKGVNEFLAAENPSAMYQLSFSIELPEPFDEDADERTFKDSSMETAGVTKEDKFKNGESIEPSLEEKAEKNSIKKKKKAVSTIHYSTPIFCDDKDSLYTFVKAYKDKQRETVEKLSSEHRIGFSEEEKAILGIES